MKNALITVVVPIYKVEAYLDECVQSILKQTSCTNGNAKR